MKQQERTALATLMKQYGIQQTYRAASGEMVRSSVDAIMAVLHALGVDTAGTIPDTARRERERSAARPFEPVLLAWNGRLNTVLAQVAAASGAARDNWQIELEDGSIVNDASLQRLPFGYHNLHVRTQAGAATSLVISAPRRCYAGARAAEWGVFAPLYGLRESSDQVIGNFGDLASLMQWTAELDGNVVATLPISAAFLRTPFEPSPYAPASRLFWNEIFLDVRADEKSAGKADEGLVDYAAVAELKRGALEPKARDFFAMGQEPSADFVAFLQAYPDAKDYAAFRAACEAFGSGWSAWPERARTGMLEAADYSLNAYQYHLYAQFLAHMQLADLARAARHGDVRLYLDMPLGVHSESYDIWRNRDLFVMAAAAGAPPDPFFTKGQNWGFPPVNPIQLRAQHYRYWRSVLQTQLRYAGVLRLDHVMMLHRLYVIPHNFEAAKGVYIRYPAEELYAVLALESARHEAVIVGEDLGTVPAEVRKSMNAHGVKRMFVVQFEATEDADQPLPDVPADSVASLNTHDMPPFAAYWAGLDADLRKELGLIDEADVNDAQLRRARTATALSRMLGAERALDAADARAALLAHLARSRAAIVLVNLEDLWLETEPQNVPGTSTERPNWRRRLKRTLRELRADSNLRRDLCAIESARQSAQPEGRAR